MTKMLMLISIGSLTGRHGVAGDDSVNAIQLHITEDLPSANNAKCGTCNGCYQLESNMCRALARYPAANERSCVQNGGLWCAMSTDANESSLGFFADGGGSGKGSGKGCTDGRNCGGQSGQGPDPNEHTNPKCGGIGAECCCHACDSVGSATGFPDATQTCPALTKTCGPFKKPNGPGPNGCYGTVKNTKTGGSVYSSSSMGNKRCLCKNYTLQAAPTPTPPTPRPTRSPPTPSPTPIPIAEADWWHAFDDAGWEYTDGGFTALYRNDCNGLNCIEKVRYAKFVRSDCYTENWWGSFDNQGWSTCKKGYFVTGLRRNSCNELKCIEQARCCRADGAMNYFGSCEDANWWGSFDNKGWSSCPDKKAMTGFWRNNCEGLNCIEQVKCCPYEE